MWKPIRIDPRIREALREQRKSILLGLVCVAITALLTGITIPLTEQAIRAIAEASGQTAAVQPYEAELAKALGEKPDRIREALAKSADFRGALPSAKELGQQLNIDSDKIQDALDSLPRDPQPGHFGTNSFGKLLRLDGVEPVQRLGIICLIVVGVFGLKYWFTRGQSYFLSQAANRLAANLRVRLYHKLQHLPVSYFGKQRVGSIQSILTNDINVYQTAVNMIRDSIDGPFKAITALIAIFWLQWQLALVAILFMPIIAWFVNRNGQKMKRDQRQVQDDLDELNAFSAEALQGTRVVKAFSAEDKMASLYRERVDLSYKSLMRAARRFAQLRPMVELIGAASLATILYICGHLARAGSLHISQIVALTMALDVVNQGIRSLSNVNNTYNQVQAATDRIYGLVLDVEEEPDQTQGEPVGEVLGEIRFENVGFQYPDGTWALQNVTFTIPAGQSLALVGPSGAGKSTLADLLLRFYSPTTGRILLDGKDIQLFELKSYRRLFGVVPQQTFLFAGTIADNIRLGRSDASDDEVRTAATFAHADSFISTLEAGYATSLGERNNRISGGEAQRVAIARALVRQPKVLLMDEATSNLDTQSEQAITQAMDEITRGRTTVFIVHRLTTALKANQIVVLRRGEVVEAGSPNQLLEANGAFAAMYKTFTGGFSGLEEL